MRLEKIEGLRRIGWNITARGCRENIPGMESTVTFLKAGSVAFNDSDDAAGEQSHTEATHAETDER